MHLGTPSGPKDENHESGISALLMFDPLSSLASPMLMITCEPPAGTSQGYGVSATEQMQAAADEHKAHPANHLSDSRPDSYDNKTKPTFIGDSSRAKLTLLWNAAPATELPIIEMIIAMEAQGEMALQFPTRFIRSSVCF